MKNKGKAYEMPKVLVVAPTGAKAREIVNNRFNFKSTEPCITY